MGRVERKEQAIEIVISPRENALMLYSSEPGFTRRLDLPKGIKIAGDQTLGNFCYSPAARPPPWESISTMHTRSA